MSPNSDAESYLQPFGGKNKNCLNDILFDSSSDESIDITSDSPYVTLDQLCQSASEYKDKLSILSLNCQSINAKFNDILLIIETLRKEKNSFSVFYVFKKHGYQITRLMLVPLPFQIIRNL